jgi:hypothetical protein
MKTKNLIYHELSQKQKNEWKFYEKNDFVLIKRVMSQYDRVTNQRKSEECFFAQCEKRGTFLITGDTQQDWLNNAIEFPEETIYEKNKQLFKQLSLFDTLSIS